MGKIGGDIRFGVAGFSSGLEVNNKRIPLRYAYYYFIDVISEKALANYDVPEDFIAEYKEDLKGSQKINDKYVIGNKIMVKYEDISDFDLSILLNAALNLVNKLAKLSNADD